MTARKKKTVKIHLQYDYQNISEDGMGIIKTTSKDGKITTERISHPPQQPLPMLLHEMLKKLGIVPKCISEGDYSVQWTGQL